MSVGVGDRAPEFTLPGTGGREYSLGDFAGRPLVLVFYPGDDTPVCTKQLNAYNDGLDQFAELDAQVVGISAQDIASHEKFSGKHGFAFPLLADTDKVVAGRYGTLGPIGFPRRSVFIIDGGGVIRYAHRAIAGLTYRPVAELLEALRESTDPRAGRRRVDYPTNLCSLPPVLTAPCACSASTPASPVAASRCSTDAGRARRSPSRSA